MVRHHHLHPVRNQKLRLHTGGLQSVHLLQKFPQIQGDPVTNDIGHMGIKNAGGQLMQRKASMLIDNGMSGIASALEPHDNIGFRLRHL